MSKKIKPWMFDGVLMSSADALLVRVDEPRWWQLGRLLRLATAGSSCEVQIEQCGQKVVCRAQLLVR